MHKLLSFPSIRYAPDGGVDISLQWTVHSSREAVGSKVDGTGGSL